MFGRDSLYVAVSAAQLGIAVVVTPVMTRLLDPAGYGNVAMANVLTQVFFAIASLGFPVSIQKWFAGPDGARRARSLCAAAVAAAFLVSALAMAGGVVGSPLVGFGSFGSLWVLTVVWGAFGTSATALSSLLRSVDNVVGFAVVTLAASVGIQATGVLVAVVSSRSATSVLEGYVLAQGFGLCVALYLTRPRWKGLSDTADIRGALAFGLPLVPQQVAGFVLYGGDRIVIQRMRDAQQVGRYQVAYNLAALAIFVVTFMSDAWLPRIFGLVDKSLQGVVMRRSKTITDRLLVPVTIGLSVGAPAVGYFWMPASYHPEQLVSVMVLIAVTTSPCADALASSRLLLTEGRTRSLALATLVAAVLNIVLNIALLPPLGLAGSALATFLTYIVLSAWERALLRRGDQLPVPGTASLVAMALSLASIFVPLGGAWLALRFGVAAACLVWLGLMLRTVRRDPLPGGGAAPGPAGADAPKTVAIPTQAQ